MEHSMPVYLPMRYLLAQALRNIYDLHPFAVCVMVCHVGLRGSVSVNPADVTWYGVWVRNLGAAVQGVVASDAV
jgi:hypothetical protein